MLQPVHQRNDRDDLIGPGHLGNAEKIGIGLRDQEQDDAGGQAAHDLKPLHRALEMRVVAVLVDHHKLVEPDIGQHLDHRHHDREGGGDTVIMRADQSRDDKVAEQQEGRAEGVAGDNEKGFLQHSALCPVCVFVPGGPLPDRGCVDAMARERNQTKKFAPATICRKIRDCLRATPCRARSFRAAPSPRPGSSSPPDGAAGCPASAVSGGVSWA